MQITQKSRYKPRQMYTHEQLYIDTRTHLVLHTHTHTVV